MAHRNQILGDNMQDSTEIGDFKYSQSDKKNSEANQILQLKDLIKEGGTSVKASFEKHEELKEDSLNERSELS